MKFVKRFQYRYNINIMSTKLRTLFVILFLCVCIYSQLASAATQATTITIQGDIPASTSFENSSGVNTFVMINGGVVSMPVTLGTPASTAVATIPVYSNCYRGFRVTISSLNSFNLCKDGNRAADATYQKMPYTVSLTNQTGTIGTNISVPGSLNVPTSGGALTFTGPAYTITAVTWAVSINVLGKPLHAGNYTDTVTLTLTSL